MISLLQNFFAAFRLAASFTRILFHIEFYYLQMGQKQKQKRNNQSGRGMKAGMLSTLSPFASVCFGENFSFIQISFRVWFSRYVTFHHYLYLFFSQRTRTPFICGVVLKSFFLSLCSLFCGLFQHRHWIFTVLTHLFQLIYLFRARFSRWTPLSIPLAKGRNAHTRTQTEEKAKFKWRPLWKLPHKIENAALAPLCIRCKN